MDAVATAAAAAIVAGWTTATAGAPAGSTPDSAAQVPAPRFGAAPIAATAPALASNLAASLAVALAAAGHAPPLVPPLLSEPVAAPEPVNDGQIAKAAGRAMAVLGEEALAPVADTREQPLCFVAEIQRVQEQPHLPLGIDVTSNIGAAWKGLFVAKVFEVGVVAEANEKAKEPFCIRPGDFIFQVNAVHSDPVAMIEGMKIREGILKLFILRRPGNVSLLQVAYLMPRAMSPGALPMTFASAPAALEAAAADAPLPLGARPALLAAAATGRGDAMTPVASAEGGPPIGDPPIERVLAVLGEDALALGPSGTEQPPLCFRIVINSSSGLALGIDVTSGIGSDWMRKGLFVAKVLQDGLVAEWNSRNMEHRCVKPGDFIYQVNTAHTDTTAMIKELRCKQSLALYILRGPVGLPLLQPPAPEPLPSPSPEVLLGINEPMMPTIAALGEEVPPGLANAERLMPRLAALGDEALAGLFCVALERRPWLRDKVIGAAARGSAPDQAMATLAPSPAEVPHTITSALAALGRPGAPSAAEAPAPSFAQALQAVRFPSQ